MKSGRACVLLGSALLVFVLAGRGGLAAEPLEFTRMFAHWDGYAGDDYLPFVAEARPQLVQLGFYGAHFWSLADTPDYAGYPAHLPVRGHKQCAAWFAERNKALHALGIKVVGHFNMTLISGEPEPPSGFFRFYHDQWDTAALGPRPAASALDLLEKSRDGRPLLTSRDSRGQYWACLRNPAWQSVLKAWIKRAIDLGVDGLVANYFYRHDCTCEHCQDAFRDYLRAKYTPDELRKKLGIAQLDGHHFPEIVSWHDPKETTRLRLAMLRFSQVSNKKIFDELFLKYARRLKPDFIAAQWDHLGEFQQISGDERCLLPAELWSQGESYLWYSTGGSACFTDLRRGVLGEATLQARFVRGASGDKPFTIGKYENTRIRVAIAELAANGGAPMGFYARFGDPAARRELVRYYRFLEKFDELYHANRSQAEVLLVYPRGRVHAGALAPVEQFRKLGGELLDRHVLFDVLPDDLVTKTARSRYAFVVESRLPELVAASPALSTFDAPRTVRISVSRPAKLPELTVHFVNYNRTEPPLGIDGRPGQGGGIDDEKPLAATGVRGDVFLPAVLSAGGRKVTAVEVITPEEPEPVRLPFEERSGRVTFAVPRFLVYAVVRIKL